MASFQKITLKDGTEQWIARIHRSGHPAINKRFDNKKKAETWARSMETKIVDEGQTVSRNPKRFTIGRALDDYISTHGPINKHQQSYLNVLKHDLGSYSVSALTNDKITKYLKAFLELPVPSRKKTANGKQKSDLEKIPTYSQSTVRKYYYVLKKVLEWHSLVNRYYLDKRIFENQPVPAAWAGQRDRRLSANEESMLIEGVQSNRKNKEAWIRIIKFALETGARLQEIFMARWIDLSLDGKSLDLPKEHVKTKKGRQIPLSAIAREIIAAQKDGMPDGSMRIFWQFSSKMAIKKGFGRLVRRVGIKDLVWHDLRHEGLSRMCSRGKLSLMEVMKISGHTSITTLDRYVKLFPSDMADKMD